MFVFNDDVKLTDLGGGVSRKILSYNDQLMSVEVHFEKGAIGSMHTHPHVQISYVLEGSFEATIGDEKKIINKGDTYITAWFASRPERFSTSSPPRELIS